jgi:cytochrome P450
MISLSILCLCTCLLLIRYVISRNILGLPYPPSPSFLEVFTEWRQGQKDISQVFEGWNKKYGPVVYARVGAKTFIILGTRRAAHELLEKRAAIYSSRGPSIFLDKYLHKGLASAFMPYGTKWRLHRRLHSNFLNIKVSKGYQSLQDVESGYLMRKFLCSNDYSDLFHQYTSNIMFALAYGSGRANLNGHGNEHESCQQHNRLHQINEMAAFILQNASGSTILLDLLPLLDCLPTNVCMGWRDKARELHKQTRKVYIECANAALGPGGSWNWSVEANTQRAKGADAGLPWEEMCYSIGELYVAGIHTTKMVLELFVKVCAEHPNVTRKAQDELNLVVGSERLPSFSDMDNLPYINAFISELLRRWPISPLGVPHMVTQDDSYMGYKIPAGSIVVANQLGINMDESVFEEPDTFDPDRYIKNPNLPPPATFGFGRRQCPGHHIARANLFIIISRMLWGYDIQPENTNKDSKSISSSEKFSIRVRSAEKRRTIESN